MASKVSSEFELDDQAISRLAGSVMETVVSYLSSANAELSFSQEAEAIEASLLASIPEEGLGPDALVALIERGLTACSRNYRNPKYMGHQRSGSMVVPVLADFATAAVNPAVSTPEMGPFSTALERRVLRWIKGLVGYPNQADGTFVSGGTEGNLTALLCARDNVWAEAPDALHGRRMKVFAADTVHYSVARAAHVLGLGPGALVKVPVGADLSMDVVALDGAIAAARDAGEIPIAVVATAGHTSTGAFDDLEACAQVCAKHGTWLHVDAAHGGAFLLASELRPKLRGVEQGDSFVWDPHKCLWAPAGCSVVLIRERRKLRASMAVGLSSAPYISGKLLDQSLSDEPEDLIGLGLACTRPLSAIRVYSSLVVYGRRRLGERLVQTCDTTRFLHEIIEDVDDFETLAPPEANILCFRYLPGVRMTLEALNTHNRAIRERLARETDGLYLSGTVVGDRYWLRAVILNPETSGKHLHELLERLRVISAHMGTEGQE